MFKAISAAASSLEQAPEPVVSLLLGGVLLAVGLVARGRKRPGKAALPKKL